MALEYEADHRCVKSSVPNFSCFNAWIESEVK
ncbi:hypothetical protein sync_0404 [Synechococcus sp. CC9311]|nr:hypothetical protein sync_0404 [Synechococcus sp. CC9311]